MIHPTLRGHFGARVDGNIKLSNFFDEMRLKRSLRPLRLLRLLRLLRPLRFLMPSNHSVIKVQAAFDFLSPKRLLRSLRPVMLSCLLRSLRLLKFSEPLRFLKSIIYWLESPYFDILKKKFFFEYTAGILVKFCPPSELRLWRTGMLLLTKSKGHTSNFHYSGFPNHLQTKSNLHISIHQSQILCVKT